MKKENGDLYGCGKKIVFILFYKKLLSYFLYFWWKKNNKGKIGNWNVGKQFRKLSSDVKKIAASLYFALILKGKNQ